MGATGETSTEHFRCRPHLSCDSLKRMNPPEPICFTEFTDGLMRPVCEDARGQYVIDDEGEQVYGFWFIPREEADLPLIVEAQP
jgi:hypothetical protein